MRERAWRYGVLLVAAVLVGYGLAWFFNNYDQVEETHRGGYTAAARANPWLAAQRFVARAGREAHETRLEDLWLSLPPVTDTLISNRLAHVISDGRRQQVLDWVEQGGHLIVVVDALSPEDGESLPLHGVLEGFDIYIDHDSEWYFAEPVTFPFDEQEITVRFQRSYSLSYDEERPPDNIVMAEDRQFVLQYEYGVGGISVISDDAFLTNWNIEDNDHAWFFYLLSGAAEGRGVWFAYTRHASSLFDWLWRHGSWIILTLALLLMLWLWSRNLRAGPTLFPLSTQRRHLGEHLQASAEFLWRHGRDRAFITAARERALNVWLQRFPALQRKSVSEQVAWVADHMGFDEQERVLLTRAESADEKELPQLTALLQAVRQRVPKAVRAKAEHAVGGSDDGPVDITTVSGTAAATAVEPAASEPIR